MTPRGATTLVLRNASKSQINSLGLIIKNTNVSKTAHLSGSNDAKIWYGIEDNIVLEPVRNNQATSEIKLLDFPLSDYEYYQLTVNDSLTAPLNILQVGYYARSNQQPAYTVLPGLSFTQRDSLKQSLIHIRFPEAVRLDKLVFSIQSPAQYHRRVVFSQLKTRKNKRGRWLQYYEPLREIYLRSDGDQTVILPGLKVADLYLSIDNQDNPPLVIKTIQAYQAEISLVAELDKDKSYQLRFGNGAAVAPAYDLLYFKDKIPAILPIAEVGTVSLTKTGEIGTAMSVFQNPWILWPALGLVLGLLGFMSYRMLGEMGKG